MISRFKISIAYFLLLLAGISSSKSENLALIVAIHEYENPDEFSFEGDKSNDKSAQLIREALLSYGYAKQNISVLKNSQADKQSIENAIRNLISQAKQGDVVTIYLKGHGILLNDVFRTNEKEGKNDNAFVCYNGSLSSNSTYAETGLLMDEEIEIILNSIRKKIQAEGKLFYLADFCHSEHTGTKAIGTKNIGVLELNENEFNLEKLKSFESSFMVDDNASSAPILNLYSSKIQHQATVFSLANQNYCGSLARIFSAYALHEETSSFDLMEFKLGSRIVLSKSNSLQATDNLFKRNDNAFNDITSYCITGSNDVEINLSAEYLRIYPQNDLILYSNFVDVIISNSKGVVIKEIKNMFITNGKIELTNSHLNFALIKDNYETLCVKLLPRIILDLRSALTKGIDNVSGRFYPAGLALIAIIKPGQNIDTIEFRNSSGYLVHKQTCSGDQCFQYGTAWNSIFEYDRNLLIKENCKMYSSDNSLNKTVTRFITKNNKLLEDEKTFTQYKLHLNKDFTKFENLDIQSQEEYQKNLDRFKKWLITNEVYFENK